MPKKKKDAETVPPAVAKQAKAAEEAQKKLQGGNDPAAEPVNPPVEPAEPAVEPAQPAQPAAEPAQPANDPAQYVPPAIADPDAVDYKSKYEVLQGKYDSEVPAMKQEVESLKMVMASMQTALENQSAAAASATPTRVESGIKALNPESYTEYGDEIVSLAKGFNAILEQNEKLVAQVQSMATGGGQPTDLLQRTERLEATVAKTAEDRYYDDLTRDVSDWRTINRSAAFDQWLRQIDPISMAARMDILQYAASTFNAQQVINIFNQFKRDSGMIQAEPAPADTVPTENDHLSGQVMPNTNLSNPNEMQPSGVNVQYPTTAELQKASRDVIAKRITQEQYDDIAARYQMAIKAGKLKP